MQRTTWMTVLTGCMLAMFAAAPGNLFAAAPDELTMIVMDPLAAPLSCPCVEGYAQRKYEVLAEHLAEKTGKPVNTIFTESLTHAWKNKKFKRADIIIGKDSVVRFDAKTLSISLDRVAQLTGRDGSTTQHGLIVVRASDPAKKVSDLDGYRIFFGPEGSDEKHTAALKLLRDNNVEISEKLEISEACSDGACQVIDLGEGVPAAAVISSYAAPLLEGCGTIKKGDLRVIAETPRVPFVTAFVNSELDDKLGRALQAGLLSAGQSPDILIALETQVGFVEPNEGEKKN